MKDLTISPIDRQNVFNNRYAIEKMQEYSGVRGILFNSGYQFALQQNN
jgi:hypothetical protein